MHLLRASVPLSRSKRKTKVFRLELFVFRLIAYLCTAFGLRTKGGVRFINEEIMDWLVNLFMGNGIASAVIILALTIAIGLLLNRIKFGSVSLGVTWVLFVGIVLSHFGLTIDPQICHFIKEFGLILFVYSIGIQVGPSFISSLRDGGIKLNMLAVLIIALGCFVAYGIHLATGEDLATMVGVLSGAVTNTPGLGAAKEAVAIPGNASAGYSIAYIFFSYISTQIVYGTN